MSGSDGDDGPTGPGLGAVIFSMVLSFTLVTVAGIYFGDINSTQAVLVGGAAAVVSAIVAVKTGKRATS